MTSIIFMQNGQLQIQTSLEIDAKIQMLNQIKNETQIRLILTFIETVLVLIATGILPTQCLESPIREFFILACVVVIQIFGQQIHLLIILYSNLNEITTMRESNTLPYPIQAYNNANLLYSSIRDNYLCFRLLRYLWVLTDVIIFIYGQIILYSNTNGECPLGGGGTLDFIWAIALIYIIQRYFSLGLPILIMVIYIIVAPIYFYFNHNANQLYQPTGATQDQISRLPNNRVESRLTEENICIICLCDFIIGEQYVTLNCHKDHVFHRQCIIDWLKTRAQCPKCRQEIQ